MERIHSEIGTPQDDQLVSAWLDWTIAQQMTPEDKWLTEAPAKRQKSLVAESQPCIAQ
jgi:hypothetical protein